MLLDLLHKARLQPTIHQTSFISRLDFTFCATVRENNRDPIAGSLHEFVFPSDFSLD